MRIRTFVFVVMAVLAYVLIQIVQHQIEFVRVDSLPKSTNLTAPFTPREGLEQATEIAKQWDSECFLQCVRIAYGKDATHNSPAMTIDGRPVPPNGWMYRYFNQSRRRFLDLVLTPDGQCRADLQSTANYLDSQPLPEEFIDSPEAFRIVEESYGEEHRKNGALFQISAQVTTWKSSVGGPRDPIPHRPNWQIHYLTTRTDSKTDPPTVTRSDLYLMLDAVSSKPLTVMTYDGNEKTIILDDFVSK